MKQEAADETGAEVAEAPPAARAHEHAALVAQLRGGEAKDVLFVPLYGADAAACGAVCSLLRIEGLWVLLDCGWTEELEPALLAPLAAVAPHVDLVRRARGPWSHVHPTLSVAPGWPSLNMSLRCQLFWRSTSALWTQREAFACCAPFCGGVLAR